MWKSEPDGMVTIQGGVGGNWDMECQIEGKAVFVDLFVLERNVSGGSTSPMFSNTGREDEKLGEAVCLQLKV